MDPEAQVVNGARYLARSAPRALGPSIPISAEARRCTIRQQIPILQEGGVHLADTAGSPSLCRRSRRWGKTRESYRNKFLDAIELIAELSYVMYKKLPHRQNEVGDQVDGIASEKDMFMDASRDFLLLLYWTQYL
ncbi:hypothetical protein CEXT_199301 [Caerostris extrusa]|uniref:Uncharacterized protein n=1 Tax=Caerostris extrusa TaxID=172846 RepID=A0AAV4WSK8_CAEEX|nr:hypothetical protein CEXT_199301 [Caerostris extrusa]